MDYIENLLELSISEDSIDDFKDRLSYNKLIESAFEDLNDFEITPQELNSLVEWANSLDVNYINESFKISPLMEANTAIAKGKNGQLIKNTSKEVADIIKKDGINKESKAKISSAFKKMLEEIDIANDDILELSKTDKDKLSKFDSANLKKAFLLLLEVIVISACASIIIAILFGPIAQTIIIGIVGPIIEELAKAVAVKGKYAVEYQVIFNLYEGTSYIIKGTASGVPFKNVLRARIAAAGMHVTTTVINWITSNPKIQEKLKIKDEDAKKRIAFIGNVVGIIIHCGWNLSALKNGGDNAFNKLLVGEY